MRPEHKKEFGDEAWYDRLKRDLDIQFPPRPESDLSRYRRMALQAIEDGSKTAAYAHQQTEALKGEQRRHGITKHRLEQFHQLFDAYADEPLNHMELLSELFRLRDEHRVAEARDRELLG